VRHIILWAVKVLPELTNNGGMLAGTGAVFNAARQLLIARAESIRLLRSSL
jgi:hypothetical protein